MSVRHTTIPIVAVYSAMGLVLGGVSNSIVVGPVARVLGSVSRWQIGSAIENRRSIRVP
ncbi:MAG TPA: hypothetical protein VGF80_03140 [Galbitalea sp.]